MIMKHILPAIAALLVATAAYAQQPGSIPMTPHMDVPLKTQHIIVPEKFSGAFDPNHTVNLPEGWTAKLFYVGELNGSRFMAWGPDSVLYVANQGSGLVYALPDRNHDGVADTAYIAARGSGHDLKFYHGAMYVAGEDQVVKFVDTDGDGVYETSSVFIDHVTSMAEHPSGGHSTRTIVFDTVRQKIYLSIGSSCNACREETRGIVAEFNMDGTGRRTYASGVRNAVGLAIHPRTGQLWATNNGNDNQGADLPPEWIDLVRDGGFYGWPFAHSYQYYNNFQAANDYKAILPITAADSARVRRMVPPAALVQAHSALMAIEFPNSNAFPPEYRRGAFVASHGSWNRFPATGYKVMYLDFANDQDTTADMVGDFLTGFQLDSNGNTWARPVGLESDSRGNLYVGSDNGVSMVLIISPPGSAQGGVDDASAPNGGLRLDASFPNPASGMITIGFALPRPGDVSISLLDLLGSPVASAVENRHYEAGEHSVPFDTRSIPAGTYVYRLTAGGKSVSRTMVVVH
ncbi:MAG: hypothetical protein JWQ98_2079 [Chlorobi bacterium]|nr:hypothetical protein [Chlorobiota bacterium]